MSAIFIVLYYSNLGKIIVANEKNSREVNFGYKKNIIGQKY